MFNAHKFLILSAAFVLGSALSASAADLGGLKDEPVAAPVATGPSGWYARIDGGYTWYDKPGVEFDPGFCALLRERYPQATVVQGNAYNLDQTLSEMKEPAAAVVSGLPLVTKPMMIRMKLMRDAFHRMEPGAPFIQFTYSVAPPIPKSLPGVRTQASERIWMNLPPARVWVYRRG